MLTIENFDKQINEAALNKGIKYYQNGAVTDIEETEDDTWEAEVEGSDLYSVEVKLNNDTEIAEYSCDCPVGGGTCKHVIAVFYAIREEMSKRSPKPEKAKRKDVFASLLERINLKEYQEFISQYVAKNNGFKTEFELWFANKDKRIDVGKKYSDLVKKIIRNNYEGGYAGYHDSFGISHDVEQLIHTGHELINKKNFRDAFALARPVFTELIGIIEHCDDSDGEISGTIENATSLVEKIIDDEAADLDLKKQMFDFLKTELAKSLYYDYGDFGYDLFSVFLKLSVKLNYAGEFAGFVDEQISKLKEGNSSYRRDFLNKQKIAFFKATGKNEVAENLIQQNLDIVEVRQGEVDKAVNMKKFAAAKKLISDGIKIAEQQQHPGTVSNWQKELLRIAVLESDTEVIRHYAKHFAFDSWNFNKEYYNQWKQTYPLTEWKGVIEAYIEEQVKNIEKEKEKKKENHFYSHSKSLLSSLGPVYIEEQYWDRILPLVQKENKLETALQYHAHLAKRYPTEMLEIYVPAFENLGDKVSTRDGYADLAGKMKKIINDIPEGKEKIREVALILKARYPRRPAMIQELNKILK